MLCSQIRTEQHCVIYIVMTEWHKVHIAAENICVAFPFCCQNIALLVTQDVCTSQFTAQIKEAASEQM